MTHYTIEVKRQMEPDNGTWLNTEGSTLTLTVTGTRSQIDKITKAIELALEEARR